MVTDWVRGLSMQHYVARHMTNAQSARRRVLDTLAALRRRCSAAIRQGALHACIDETAEAPVLHLTIRGALGAQISRRVRRKLTRMLREPGTRLTLAVEIPVATPSKRLTRLLQRLDRYGERVSLRLREDLHDRIEVALERLHVVLEPSPSAPHERVGVRL